MRRFIASVRKESLLLMRDWHAQALLFAMPALFIIIMSLALQDRFGSEQTAQFPGYLTGQTQSFNGLALEREFKRSRYLALQRGDGPLSTNAEVFAISFTPHFDQALEATSDQPGLILSFAPELGVRERSLIRAAVQEAVGRMRAINIANELGHDSEYAEREFLLTHFIATTDPAQSTNAITPTAVQQNVPAWLIFAMFFIAVPLSTTIIEERNQRTLARLRTLGAPVALIYGAKLLPYFLINLLQLTLMLAVGIYILPLLGGDQLSLTNTNLPALAVMGIATSLAALSCACLIAASTHTIQQASISSAAGNLLLAALGGVMVPVFMMPDNLQTIAEFSPMHWALSGFIELIVRQGGWSAIYTPAIKLISLAIILFILATMILKRSTRHASNGYH
ncbi:ABC transporter permease [Gilvimarinus chinensis]|uniref:ABC transporter permease n=1 Tax=Gilvimarinus chinensis TaxID=396005 RepID=UPI00036653F7|nr:ABC transporter permease [Gilvimarinus chinensis]